MAYDVHWRTERVGSTQLDLLVLRDFEATVDVVWERLCRQPDGDQQFETLVPMFGWLWPSSRVLAQAVEPCIQPGQRVLELGCGLALPSMVCARRGAQVLATDMHPDTPAFLTQNLARNRLTGVHFERFDWREPPSERIPAGGFDHLLASDVLYDAALADLLAGTIDRLLSDGGTAWVADPGRPWLERFEERCQASTLTIDMDVHSANDAEAFILQVRRG